MANNINLGAPRVPPGSTSLAVAYSSVAERDDAVLTQIREEYERLETLISVLDRAQLLDLAGDTNNVRLGSAMFMTIADIVYKARETLSAIERTPIAEKHVEMSS